MLNFHSSIVSYPLSGFAFTTDWFRATGSAREFLNWTDDPVAQLASSPSSNPFEPWSPAEIEDLIQFNIQIGNSGGANLAKQLAFPNTRAVATGQQPNLLASPLYILHKALGITTLAQKLHTEVAPVIPLFWIASDDHDFYELRDCWIPSNKGALINLGELVSRGTEVPAASPAYEWRLDSSKDRLIAAITQHLQETAPNALEFALQALDTPATFETVFARMLVQLLGDRPILFAAPRLKTLRVRQRKILEKEFLGKGETSRLVHERGEQLTTAGYGFPIQRTSDQLNAFYLSGNIRARMLRRGERVIVQNPATRQTIQDLTIPELMDTLEKTPELFSTNVITRPLLQDTAFPVITYLAGPGEIAYLAQLTPAYGLHGLNQSLILPRPFLTLVDPLTCAWLELNDYAGQELAEFSRTVEEKLISTDPELGKLVAVISKMEHDLSQGISSMREHPIGNAAHLAKAFDKTSHSLHQSFQRLRTRLGRQMALMGSPDWITCTRVLSILSPLGAPQERVLSPLSFLSSPGTLSNVIEQNINFARPEPKVVFI